MMSNAVFESAFFPPPSSQRSESVVEQQEQEQQQHSPREKPCIEPHPRPSKPIVSRALRFSKIPKPKIFYTPEKKKKGIVISRKRTTPVRKILAKPMIKKREILNVREDLKRTALIRFPSSRVSLWSRDKVEGEAVHVTGLDPRDIVLTKELLTEIFAESTSQDLRMRYVKCDAKGVASGLSETKRSDTYFPIHFESTGVSEGMLATPRRELKVMYEDVLQRKFETKPCDSFDAVSCVVSVLPHRVLAVRLDLLVPKSAFDLHKLHHPMPLFDCPLSRALENGAGVGTRRITFLYHTHSKSYTQNTNTQVRESTVT